MGATNFMTTAKGKSLDDAFDAATYQARFEYGHGGYTGSIAEKDHVMEVRPPMRVPPGTRKTTYLQAVHIAEAWSWMREDTGEDLKGSRPRYIKRRKQIAKEVDKFNAKGFDMAYMCDMTDHAAKWEPCCGMRIGRSNEYVFWGIASE